MVIPYDGSKDKDGLDKAGHCGEKYKKKSPLKGIALTELYVLFRLTRLMTIHAFADT